MSSHADPIATLTSGAYKAEIYSNDLPGEFTIRFLDSAGSLLESTTLSGVSTYRQREDEIRTRLDAFAAGTTPPDPADLSSAGEY